MNTGPDFAPGINCRSKEACIGAGLCRSANDVAALAAQIHNEGDPPPEGLQAAVDAANCRSLEANMVLPKVILDYPTIMLPPTATLYSG